MINVHNIMKVVGAVSVVLSSVYLLITYMLFRPMMNQDLWILKHNYGSLGDTNGPYHNYEYLYEWTDNLVRQRNHYAMSFYVTLGVSCLIIGVILLLWRKDRMNIMVNRE